MAKKRTKIEGKSMPAVAGGTGLKLVRLQMPPDVHKQFRVEAAREGLSMAAMARRLVVEWVAKRTVGGR